MIPFLEEDFFAEPYISKDLHTIFCKKLSSKSFLLGVFKESHLFEVAESSFNEESDTTFKISEFIEKFLSSLDSAENEGFTFLYISGASEIQYILWNMPPVLIGNLDGSSSKLIASAHAPTSQSFTISSQPFLNISNILIADKDEFLTPVEREFPKLFSKKELLDFVSENAHEGVKENLNFAFINCNIKNYVKFTIHEKVESSLESVCAFEEKLPEILSESFSDNVIYNTNSSLVFSELILNAFEHGILGISPELKQQLILEDKFDAYIAAEEKKYDKKIDVSISFYDDKILKITINDHGEGFDFYSYMEKLSNISESSFRGRGLIMTLNICTALFYGERGNEVTFYVRYKEEESPKDFKLDEEAYLRSLTLLYVEDDEFIRSSMSHMLKRDVKTLYLAADGQEGLEKYKENRPNIIITDVEMPRLDGLDMTEQIKAENKEEYVIVTTGYSSEEFLIKAIDVGVDKFLVKPITVSKLRETLRECARTLFYKDIATKQASLNLKNITEEISELKAKNSHITSTVKSMEDKEKLIIKDDSNIIDLDVAIYHKLKEPLSGEIYGIAKIDGSRTLYFIIESMSNLGSSHITSLISSMFLSNHIEKVVNSGSYELAEIANTFITYIQNYLLEDEIVSFTLAEIDIEKSKLTKIGFGMQPTIIFNQSTGKFEQGKSLNPPLSKHSAKEFKTFETALDKQFSLLSFTDSLIDNDKITLATLEETLKNNEKVTDLNSKVLDDKLNIDLTILQFTSKS